MKGWLGLSAVVEGQLGVDLMRSGESVLELGVRGVRWWWNCAVPPGVRETMLSWDLVLEPCVWTLG
jgi:hypothetical protein